MNSLKARKPKKPKFYEVEVEDPAQKDVENYDGENHQVTNETIDWQRSIIRRRDR